MKKPKLVDWKNMVECCMVVRKQLESEGMLQPSIRSCYYRLVDSKLLPERKGDYNTLCSVLGKMRDRREIEMELFSASSSGVSHSPMTDEEITEAIGDLKGSIRASLHNGFLWAIVVEKGGLVDNIAWWLDYGTPVASCEGQLRREFLYAQIKRFVEVCEKLGGNKVKILYLGDMDKWGQIIGQTKIRWMKNFFGKKLEIEYYAVTPDQMKSIGRKIGTEIHLDGFIASYGPQKFRNELREKIGLDKESSTSTKAE